MRIYIYFVRIDSKFL